MSDVRRNVETQFTLADFVTAPLRNMHAAANVVANSFDRASLAVSRYGTLAAGAAGVYGAANTIMGAQNYLRIVRDINAATGFQAEQVDSVLEVMDRANISAEEGSQIIQKLSISMQRYKMEVQRTGAAQSDASRIIQKLGVNLKAGPQAAMLQMARLAQQNKLTMADLNIAFQVSETSAIRLQALLRRGPQEVGRIMSDLQKQGLAITAGNLAAFNKYEQTVIRIRSAWARIAIVVGSRVLPQVTKLLEGGMEKLEAWTANADEWGRKVTMWLDRHLGKLITIGKVMAANMALQAVTGVGVGQVAAGGAGLIGKLFGGGSGAGAGVAVEAATAAVSVVKDCCAPLTRAASTLAGAPKKYMDPAKLVAKVQSGTGAAWAGAPAAAATGGGPGFLSRISILFGRIGTSARRLSMMVGKFTIVGTVITLAVGTLLYSYTLIKNNVLGIRDLIIDWWVQLQARVLVVWDLVRPLFNYIGKILGTSGPVGRFFSVVLATAIQTLGTMVDNIMHTVQAVIILIRRLIEEPLKVIRSPMEAILDAFGEAQYRTEQRARQIQEQRAIDALPLGAIGRRTPEERPPTPVMDFRGSKFDITQQFAEGFDPDRMAVAFTNDLATLGERRLQSGLAPLFSVR